MAANLPEQEFSMQKRIGIVLAIALLALTAVGAQGMYLGLGHASNFRLGPGKDSTGTQVYSFNFVFSSVIFDAAGKVVDCEFDALEVSTPNYDGASMPHFAGWPGSPEPNFTDHKTEKVAGKAPTTVEAVAADINGWKTKRDRGDDYGMNPRNDWYHQMDVYEKLFVGKTMDEINAWFARYFSDVNGRPLNPETKVEKDMAKVALLNEAEKAMLVDVRSGATMSLNDAHGPYLAALKSAWENRKPLAK